MKLFKGKPAGQKGLFLAAVLGAASATAYLIFGNMAQVFQAPIFAILCGMTAAGLLGCVYHGFFADYLPPVMAALAAAGLVRLGQDSINDLTAFFVGMGDYFGNADNVGPRVLIFVLILLTALTAMISTFLKSREAA